MALDKRRDLGRRHLVSGVVIILVGAVLAGKPTTGPAGGAVVIVIGLAEAVYGLLLRAAPQRRPATRRSRRPGTRRG